MDKADALLDLARRRQAMRLDGYACIGDFDGGLFECGPVSPCTKLGGNVDAAILVVGRTGRAPTGSPAAGEYAERDRSARNPMVSAWPSLPNAAGLPAERFWVTLNRVGGTHSSPLTKSVLADSICTTWF